MSQFQQTVDDVKAAALKSDLTNLAQALIQVDKDIAHLDNRRAILDARRRDISVAAADRERGDIDPELIRSLYERSQGYVPPSKR